MNLCQSTWSTSQISIPVTALDIHYFSFSYQKQKKRALTMMLQTVAFQALTSLSSWYMLFQ